MCGYYYSMLFFVFFFFFFKQKTAYEMRISDWSSDVCSSDLVIVGEVMLAASAIEIIGGTPLIALDRIYTGPGRIIAKAEFLLPGGSVKDRAAKAILLAAREDGRLKPGMPVVERTRDRKGVV